MQLSVHGSSIHKPRGVGNNQSRFKLYPPPKPLPSKTTPTKPDHPPPEPSPPRHEHPPTLRIATSQISSRNIDSPPPSKPHTPIKGVRRKLSLKPHPPTESLATMNGHQLEPIATQLLRESITNKLSIAINNSNTAVRSRSPNR